MAEITLADWTCGSNSCLNPLLTSPLQHLPHYPCLIPAAWSLTSSTLSSLHLSFLPTDLSFILHGNISICHLHSLFHMLHPTFPRIPTKSISNFEKHDLTLLKHFGTFLLLSISPLSHHLPPFPLHFPSSQYYLTHNWPLLTNWFSFLPLLLRSICLPNSSILLPPSQKKALAENSILALSRAPTHSSPYHLPSKHCHLLASDGSMVSNPFTGQKSVMFTVTANSSTFSVEPVLID